MVVDAAHTWRDFDAVVIDLDGVVSPTLDLHLAAWQSLLDEFLAAWSAESGRVADPFDAQRDYPQHIRGRAPADAVQVFLRSRGIDLPYGTPADPPDTATCWGLGNRKHGLVAAALAEQDAGLFPDAAQLIDVATAAGKRLALTSSEGIDGAAISGLADRAGVVLSERAGVVLATERRARGRRRPADVMLLAAERLGVRPPEALVLTSAPVGVAAAHAGGFGLVVGVGRDGQLHDLATAGADLIVESLAELITAPVPPDSARELMDTRTFEAIVVYRPEEAASPLPPLLPVLAELRATGVEVLVVPAGEVPNETSVEICPEIQAGTALARLYRRLDRRGIGPGLVLIAGRLDTLAPPPAASRSMLVTIGSERRPEHLPLDAVRVAPGTLSLLSVLADQLTRRKVGRVPTIDRDPAWTIELQGDKPEQRRVHQTLLTIADSRFGTRGVREEEGAGGPPRVLAAGIFDETTQPPILLQGPIWTELHFLAPVDAGRDRRILDLRTGVLIREQPAEPHPVRTMRFMSLARPGAFVMRAEGGVDQFEAGSLLLGPGSDGTFVRRKRGDRASGVTTNQKAGRIAAAAVQRTRRGSGHLTLERLAAYVADADGGDRDASAAALLEQMWSTGFEGLLADHRAAWASRWRDADVAIAGDPELELAVRYNLFHLIGCSPTSGESAVGARGVAGPGYGGHVFWDADVFVLPFLAATCPPAARAMLEYRIRRLAAARRAALASGRDGVRFPWESARDGTDVTPTTVPGPAGGVLRILTGELEEHIQADVAWAATRYAAWTGDEAFLSGAGRPLVLDTARYWASRIRTDADGRGHIDRVIGPDEYHEDVDDNAFTNIMARWNLRRAAELAEHSGGADADEIARWRTIADSMVDHFEPATGRYEQFTGYWQLEPLIISELAETPVAADLLFGQERISASQIIKQPDVLMFQHLVPEEAAPGSLRPNLEYYEPRCAHGSSLSPAIHAALFARDGRPDDGLRLFRMACLLDLHNLTGTTAGGLHTATAGGVWQALVQGFGGIRPTAAGLTVDPRLPSSWEQVRLGFRYRGQHVRVLAGHEELFVEAEAAVTLIVPGAGSREITAGRWRRHVDGWEVIA